MISADELVTLIHAIALAVSKGKSRKQLYLISAILKQIAYVLETMIAIDDIKEDLGEEWPFL